MDRIIEKVHFDTPVQPKATRVAAYARVSTDKDTMLHSLSAQVSYYSEMIQNHSGWIYAGVYSDEAQTGTKANRPGFQKLLEDCRAGCIDLVLVKSVSRLARNTVTLLETVRELKSIGVDVFFEEQNIHTISSEGELMLTILASYAQEESLSVSENMKWKVRKSFENGIPWNGTVLGYRIVDGKYEVIPEEAAIVRLIYELYLDGLGYERIARELKSRGLKTRNGNEWNHSSVFCILHNYSYTGNLMLQSTYTENHITKKHRLNKGEYPMYYVEKSHEAIIPREMFDAVQKESERRAAKYNKIENQNLTAYTGRVFCGKCGARCRRKMRNGKHVWLCNTSSTQGKVVCAAKAVPESVLDSIEEKYKVQKLILCDENEIEVILENGESFTEKWEYRSRSESWTAEMRQRAREQTTARHQKKWQNET